MPELPEVQTVVTSIRPSLLGRRIVAVNLTRADIVTPADVDLPRLLTGKKMTDVARRGKRIILTLNDANCFFIHLGMTGRLSVCRPDQPVAPHTHLLIDFAPAPKGLSQLRFTDPRRFGGVTWLGTSAIDENMGPEPLTLRPAQLARQLERTTRAVKSALLDQSVVAGLGNIYVDESLFLAAIHPLTPANRLSMEQIAELNRSIKFTLRKAINYRGSTLKDYRDPDGNPGGYQLHHRVYDRKGQPCVKCKTPIERIVLGGRSTCFCPKCQLK